MLGVSKWLVIAGGYCDDTRTTDGPHTNFAAARNGERWENCDQIKGVEPMRDGGSDLARSSLVYSTIYPQNVCLFQDGPNLDK